MSDDVSKRGEQDRDRISLNQEHEVRYWTKQLGITREQLYRAVDSVGNEAAKVREHLNK
jgi:uncharacterized protein DUF3606